MRPGSRRVRLKDAGGRRDVRENAAEEKNERGKKEYRGKGKEMKKRGREAARAQGGKKKRMRDGRHQKKKTRENK